MRRILPLVLPCILLPLSLHATVFGRVEGVVHDARHRPVSGATVLLRAADSAYTVASETDAEGAFRFLAVPLGAYVVQVKEGGFATVEQPLTLQSDTSPVLHVQLSVETRRDSMVVHEGETANVDSVTPTTLVDREEIADTPGADRTNSLAMITDFVPGAYITHDQLHMRGGHQVSWELDGVEIPNTNIASNVGAQIDPKDIDYLEVQRGSYNADVGDRTYGVFNVVPRSGFERNGTAELVTTLGSFFETDDQLNYGSHTEKLGLYGSLNGNRSDYGLSPPVARVLHDAANGYGGFASLIDNQTPTDQLRAVVQLRTDFFQIPYDPDPNSVENSVYDSSRLRDTQREVDGLAETTWAHSFTQETLLQVSPFYHYNRADLTPGAADSPVATTSDRASNYAGLQASITGTVARQTLEGGFYGFGQHDSYLFGAVFSDGSAQPFRLPETAAGGVIEEWVSDNWKATPWLTLTGGLRQTLFTGAFSENSTDPRLGAAVRVPRLGWVFRGFYGRFYQPPPLLTAAGPIVTYAMSQNTSFAPLHGERDEEHQFGVQIPLPGLLHGWLLDADNFQTRANNFLDHANLGESSIYYPVTLDGALIRGWELTLRSPRLPHGGGAHLSYSNQIAEQRGAITGGLICVPVGSAACDAGFSYTPVDHDQRNTLSVGYRTALPWHAWADGNVSYGSGFTNGTPDAQHPGPYLPQHESADLSVGRSFGESASFAVNAVNVANTRVLLDNSLTFGGFHYSDPRQIYGELRVRFHVGR